MSTPQSLPRDKQGFLVRGKDMTRLETFTDAAFAFALTLLVISIDTIPQTYDEFIVALKHTPAFAVSFAIMMMFWFAHNKWSRRYGLEDGISMVLSFILVFIMLVYVYPLKIMFGGALEYFSGGFFPSNFELGTLQHLRTLFVIYSIGYTAVSCTLMLLNWHALRLRETLALDAREIFHTETDIGSWIIQGLFGLTSITLAITLPGPWVMGAGMLYFALAIVMPVYAIRRGRKQSALGL